MPTYVFRCPYDEETREVQQSFDSIFVPVCECGRSMIKKFFPVGAIFAGTGWGGTKKGTLSDAREKDKDTSKSSAPSVEPKGKAGAA